MYNRLVERVKYRILRASPFSFPLRKSSAKNVNPSQHITMHKEKTGGENPNLCREISYGDELVNAMFADVMDGPLNTTVEQVSCILLTCIRKSAAQVLSA